MLSGRPDHPRDASSDHIVYVVDDDDRVRAAVENLLASRGYSALTFASAAEFIGKARPELPSCLVLDVELPDMSGLELQQQLSRETHPPH